MNDSIQPGTMKSEDETYLMVLPVAFYRVAPGRFATESAFAGHLRMLKQQLGGEVSRLVVAGPQLSCERFVLVRSSWLEIDEEKEGILYHPLYSSEAGNLEFLMCFPKLLIELYREVRRCRVVHAGPSPLYRPVTFASLLLGASLGKATISVTDIDNRGSARMNYETGCWSRRQYLITKLVHVPAEHLQQLLIARICSLVLLKGKKLAADYGYGRPHVRNFLDSAYGVEHIISDERLREKLMRIRSPQEPLRVTFYGRLVAYKGVDHMLRALRFALDLGGRLFSFDIFGQGAQESQLRELARELRLESVVKFHGAVPFGPEFFETLQSMDVLLAAPLSQDTPRSALDAQASGQYVVAYDTYYYRDLQESGAAVEVVPWRDVEAMGRAFFVLLQDRDRLTQAIERGVAFARQNTQEIWLHKRLTWARQALRGETISVQPDNVEAKPDSDLSGF